MKPRLFFALAALVVVPAVVVWGLVSPNGSARSAVPGGQRISYPSPTASPTASPTLTVHVSQPATAGLRQVFDQNYQFPGTAMDTSKWTTCYPWHNVPTGCSNFGNTEREWYLPSQDLVYGGALHLAAARKLTSGTTRSGQAKVYACRSGMVTSFPSLRFKFGYVKVRATLAAGYGLWSAIWLAAANFKWPPEIDIVESWGKPWVRTGVYFHPLNAHGSKTHLTPAQDAALTKGWHTFAVWWTYKEIVWYIDGRSVMVVTKHIPHQPMYLIMNLADYSLTKSGGCHGRLLVRSVQVWQK